MSISFPRTDILDSIVGYSDQVFKPVSRQGLSTQADGVVRGKDYGSALWSASYTTAPLTHDKALEFEAKLASLDGVIWPFEAYDVRRSSPLVPGGNATATISVIPDGKTLTLSGLASGQVLSVGDYLSFDYSGTRALHQIMQTVTASGGTATVEVRPHIRAGVVTSTTVQLASPRGLFTLLPGSVDAKPQGVMTIISFQAMQYLT